MSLHIYPLIKDAAFIRNELRQRKKGVALIVVLSFLLLISALVLSFFMSVTTETKASRQADNASRSKELVDTTINVVMAQIRAATTQGSNVAWASQPGMIRTFGERSGQGGTFEASSNPLTYFKLYSAKEMTWSPDGISGPPFSAIQEVPADWYTSPALYSDLNMPILALHGEKQYPIVNPESSTLTPKPVGFSVTSAPVNNPAKDNLIPMPVRWLYILKDGTITAPSAGSAASGATGSKATWETSDSTSPRSDNPIIGRIAFWTDDETCKININTAAGDVWANTLSGTSPEPGAFWDVPRINTTFEQERLAKRQVGQFEYQRYPGHPATTYLSAVFPNLTRAGIGNLTPRVEMGGSLGGTVVTTDKIALDATRLYATVDELAFNPARLTQEESGVSLAELQRSRFFVTANGRSPEINLFNQPRISIWPLHVNDSTDYRTAFDRLIAFCARANNHDYSFQRNDAYSPTSDFSNITRNQQLYTYLQKLTSTAVPGFGGTFTDASKYLQDRDQILTEILDYIRSTNLFDDTLEPQDQNNPAAWTFPTKGKQFTSPRTRTTDANKRMGGQAGHGQVTPLFISNGATSAQSTMGFGRFNTVTEVGLHFICTADGRGNPALDPPTVENTAKLESNLSINRTLGGQTLGQDQIRVEALFLMELFSVAQGWNALNEDFQIRVVGLDGLVLKGNADGGFTPLKFPNSGTIHINKQPFAHTRTIGGSNGFRVTLADRGLPERVTPEGFVLAKDSNSTNLVNTYPFVSSPVTIKPGSAETMELDYLGTEPIRIEIYAQKYATIPPYSPTYAPDPGTLVQTIYINFTPSGFKPALFPSPRLVVAGHDEMQNGTLEFASTKENFWTFARTPAIPMTPAKYGRLYYITRPPNRTDRQNIGGLFRDTDTLRTLVPEHGDYRHVAAQREVPVELFAPHQYYSSTDRVVHSFTEGYRGHDMIYNSTRTGKLAPLSAAQNYHQAFSPDVPFKSPYWGSDSGDWDHGTGITPDGAYINKPDEGHNASSVIPYFVNDWDHEASGPTFFSPNRQVMSAGMFGSLPTQIKSGVPWRTLLFRPDTSTIPGGHIGARSPKDHLLLDLFWMPVVEPYAISEPFSTAGKINMNYQLMPFTYIKRTTGLRALFQSERIGAVPLTAVASYKSGTSTNYHYQIDDEKTLQQFEDRFNKNDIFRSASEICDLFLIPKGVPNYANLTATAMKDFWQTHALTGDNLRERPYATLYPRLTTKSNTYTVHYRVQALQQVSRSRGDVAANWANWEENRDHVLSETRGSTTIERYIDAADPNLPDYATASSPPTLDNFYRFRVINTKKFAP